MLIIPVEESYRLWCALDMAVYKQQIKSVVEKMKNKLCHAAMVGRRLFYFVESFIALKSSEIGRGMRYRLKYYLTTH